MAAGKQGCLPDDRKAGGADFEAIPGTFTEPLRNNLFS